MLRQIKTNLLISAVLLLLNAQPAIAELSDDKIPESKEYYTYCMSKRDYGINLEILNSSKFVSDISESSGLKVEVYPSCNFSRRNPTDKINAIVLHYTNGDADDSYLWWQKEYPGTSAHYIVKRDGTIIQAIPERYVSYHIGCYWNEDNCTVCPPELCDNHNYFFDPIQTTIAIEIENDGPLFLSEQGFYNIWKEYKDRIIYQYTGNDLLYHASEYYEDYNNVQLESLKKLINDIQTRHGELYILGHSDIQDASVDPGPAFPWESFSEYKLLHRVP